MRLRAFDSGVLVVQSLAHDEQAIIDNTAELVYQHESLTAHDLAHQIGIAIMLASERLAITEKAGRICKDDSVEGLRFYPNRFLDEQQ
jgi:ESCRT-II complex subunit VPS36